MNVIIAGIDEAGRGPLAGPVIAAIYITKNYIEGVKDSKKLSKKKRESLFDDLVSNGEYGVGIVDNNEIDKINILNATKLACVNAYKSLRSKVDLVLVDGNMKFDLQSHNFLSIIKGDDLYYSIAASSIIAKVTRSKIMSDLSAEYPQYLWDQNDGYGTKQHIEAIKKYGLTRFHRKSFCEKFLISL